jgi:hypothetical protein
LVFGGEATEKMSFLSFFSKVSPGTARQGKCVRSWRGNPTNQKAGFITNINANRRMTRIIFVFIRDIRSFVSLAMKIQVRFSTCTVARFIS